MPEKTTFVLLDRNVRQWALSKDAYAVQLWVLLLVSAAYKDTFYEQKAVLRGQLLTTYKELSDKTGQCHRRLKRSMEELTQSGAITVTEEDKFIRVTLTNYNSYQERGRK